MTSDRRTFPELGRFIRAARLARRWTQPELAARAGVNTARISEIERGAAPSVASVDRLAQALGFRGVIDLFQSGGDDDTAQLLRTWRALDPLARRDALDSMQAVAVRLVAPGATTNAPTPAAPPAATPRPARRPPARPALSSLVPPPRKRRG